MRKRYLTRSIDDLCFGNHKIAFVSGPRQCGKTTLAKMELGRRKTGRYCNWDDIEFRRVWTRKPRSIVPRGRVPLVVLDEIHKARGWKRTLKGVYDTLEKQVDFLVTGSARLEVYRKGGDSLLGRYLPFRLHPFSLGELRGRGSPGPDRVRERLFARALKPGAWQRDGFEGLLGLGPFPEPLLGQDERRARLWRRTRVEAIIRQDLRDLTRIPELSRIEMLASLLPERVGSRCSVSSLREDLEVSHPTVKRWLLLLGELFYIYELKPYSKRIVRSLKKDGKIYMWDWSEVGDPASRFENLVAGHLLKACHFWTDTGEGIFRLHYLRDKEKREIDFLVTRDDEPWLPVEAKLSDTSPSRNWPLFMRMLGCKRALQVVGRTGHWRMHAIEGRDLLVASAEEALAYFV